MPPIAEAAACLHRKTACLNVISQLESLIEGSLSFIRYLSRRLQLRGNAVISSRFSCSSLETSLVSTSTSFFSPRVARPDSMGSMLPVGLDGRSHVAFDTLCVCDGYDGGLLYPSSFGESMSMTCPPSTVTVRVCVMPFEPSSLSQSLPRVLRALWLPGMVS